MHLIQSRVTFFIFSFIAFLNLPLSKAGPMKLEKNDRVVLLGNGLGSRMMEFGFFESDIHERYPNHNLVIRNMCDEGNTPGFRPHSGRPSPWAFSGAEKFYSPLSKAKDRWGSGHVGVGDYPSPDEWLEQIKPDKIIAFFGFNESFRGLDGLDNFRGELKAFIKHTLSSKYNGHSSPELILVSPIAFEDISANAGTPDGQKENGNLALYTAAIREVANEEDVPFVDMFLVSQRWFQEADTPLTRDGALLNERGYKLFSRSLAQKLFGPKIAKNPHKANILSAVREKNWLWHNYYKIPNGVHVFGRRHRPFGPQNYPDELIKLDQMTTNRDQAIWAAVRGSEFNLAYADTNTHVLPETKTNYRPSGKNGSLEYKYGKDAVATFKTAPGYKIELFASEKEFPNLANPVQMAFDNKGRLWVSTMPSYPHYQPGDPKPNDKLIILEDVDNDGKADKEIVFAENLHLPTGFEFAPEGVFVAQGSDLVLLKDNDGDDKADLREVVLSGFDDHDTHHVISAFCADPSGAIYMGEGTFLHSNVETAYGPVRSSNGGFFRYSPQRKHLERSTRISIPNPWGTAVDAWGQIFFLDTSDPNMSWMVPMTSSVKYGEFSLKSKSLVEKSHRVRPTSGLEFVSSRHFPEEVQGDILLNNTIGFLGTKQHSMKDEGTGYVSKHRHDLVTSSDGNYRPVDLEFAPDGSLYIVDWHNVLVGHMQHSARDPLRDHVHGRVFRITYPSRPLVKPAKIAGAPIKTLLDNLKLPEDRTRYRTRRELRSRDAKQVLQKLEIWIQDLNTTDEKSEHHMLEALWVTWGLNQIDETLLRKLLQAKSYKVRAAAVRTLRYNYHSVSDHSELLDQAIQDKHGRVRLEAIAAASWLNPKIALPIVQKAADRSIDEWIQPTFQTALANLEGRVLEAEKKKEIKTNLVGREKALFVKGLEVYNREGHCATCHQEDGNGLPAAQFPPLTQTKWVLGDKDKLIKLTLHGLLGPIVVKGKKYPGQVPMTPFKGLSDEEIASVLTYVRNDFGNQATPIYPEEVQRIRKETKDQSSFINPKDI